MANATTLQTTPNRLLGLSLGDWELIVSRRHAPRPAASREVTFATGMQWASAGLTVGALLLAAAAMGLGL